ncbi:hypothetical protein RHGRI_024023 [Rhododendron griersonianum]|uniref:Uncharacterized protein n=1 Tax=Rhododendron griersonianum TaxID=479676 RepID=A0AAV6J815_9ERIC|nr:hypothetical protein RHGRI_024023 [Rhododendron griersonianum]
MPTTVGSRVLEGYRPPFDAAVVRKLREGGAIIFGKTNLDDFGIERATEGSAYQALCLRNPTTLPSEDARVPHSSPAARKELCDAKDAEVNRKALENQIAELVSQTNIEEQDCQAELNACNQIQLFGFCWNDRRTNFLQATFSRKFLLINHLKKMLIAATSIVTEKTGSSNSDLVLKYQWFVGERTPSNFIAIPKATGETSFDGNQTEVKDAATTSYILSVDDIGFFVSVSCEPVRSDWARGPIVLSEQIGPIIPGPPTRQSLKILGSFVEGQREKGDCFYEWFRLESNGVKDKLLNAGEFLDLRLEDVGRCLELVYTPVCKDGVKGSATCVLSSAVSPEEPMGVELVIPDCCEDQIVVPQKTYFGGQ